MTTAATRPAPPGRPLDRPRTIAAWALWDWGSAAWNAVITTFVFTTWITSRSFVPDELVTQETQGNAQATAEVAAVMAEHTTWLSWGTAVAGVAIALAAPVLGARADASGRRRLWLGINTTVVVVLSALLVLINPDATNQAHQVMIGVGLLSLGNIFFELASVNYNAMLNQISTPHNRGRISGLGWGAGYLGGIVLLLIVFTAFINPDVGLFGVTSDGGWDVRLSVLLAAVWFALWAIPVFFAVPHHQAPVSVPPTIRASYVKVARDVASLWRNERTTMRFLIAAAIYRDGLAGVFLYGGLIASTVFGFSPSQVIMFAIAANVVSGVATMIFGFIEDTVGPRVVILVSLIGMIVSGFAVFVGSDSGQGVFWVGGLFLCVFVGPAQSASRSTVSRLARPTMEGELFGLYAMTGRVVSFLAPLAFGVMVALFGDNRFGVLGLVLILLLGVILVWPLRLTEHTTPHPSGDRA